MPTKPDPKNVPLIIQDIERDVPKDVKKAAGIIGDIIFGDFFGRHGFTGRAPEPPPEPLPKELPPVGQRIQLEKRIPPSNLLQRPVIEAELVCETCDGTRKLGAKGHEVPCPACGGCPTCEGRGKLGKAGHEIPCPVCQSK